MIVLQKLKWSNCFSYGADNEIDLSGSSLTQILGINGTGKSSIPLIVEEILFNKNSKNTKKVDIPNRHLDGSYRMELYFQVDQDNYSIRTHRVKNTLKVKLFKGSEDISSHTATNTFKSIKDLLGIDFSIFSQLVYQNTNSSLQFLTASDTDRKKFLIDLLNLSKYVKLFNVFKEAVKEYNTTITRVKSRVDTIEKWLSENNLEGMMVLPSLNLEINLEEDEKLLGSLQAEIKNISEKNKKISANNMYKQQLSAIDLSTHKDVEGSIESIDSLNTQLGALKKEKSNAEDKIKTIKSLSNVCPTCKQEIDDEFKRSYITDCTYDFEEAVKHIEEVEDSITRIRNKNRKIKAKQEAETKFSSLYQAIDKELPEELLDADSLQAQISVVSTTLSKKRAELEAGIAENNRRERNNTKISLIQEQTEDFENKLAEASKELEESQKVYKNLEILKKAFSTNGLLAYKIEYLVKELEDLVNDYLAELSDGRFTLTFVVTNDKLNVELTDDGRETDIKSLSSGELARVNTSTLLAIRKLMNSLSKSQINVLFLDEVIAVLDDIGREKLIDVLVKEDKLNTFIVSHHWSHPLLTKLSILKEGNISRVEYG